MTTKPRRAISTNGRRLSTNNRRLILESLESRNLLAGDLDVSFGTNGKVVTPFYEQLAGGDEALAIASQSDGKLVVGGFGGSISRYFPDGTVDTSFGELGKSLMRGGVSSMAVDAQDRIITVGTILEEFNQNIQIVSWLPNGKVDGSFGDDGILVPTDGFSNAVTTIAVQPDGKVLVGIRFNSGTNSSIDFDFALERYNTNGTLDSTFGINGRVVTSLGGTRDVLGRIVVLPDGRILATGVTGTGVPNSTDTALVRYLPDGSLDTSFDVDGIQTINLSIFNSDDSATSVALLADGKILVGGGANNGVNIDFLLARFNSDGSLDTTFNSNGPMPGASEFTFGSGFDVISDLAVNSNGQFWALGVGSDNFSSNTFSLLMRFNSDGALDTNYDSDGWMRYDFPGHNGLTSNRFLLRSDESLVAAGGIRIETEGFLNSEVALVGFTAAGLIDPSFGDAGFVNTPSRLGSSFASRGTLQNDGKIIVLGSTSSVRAELTFGFEYQWAMARYNPDGSLDPTFGGDGRVATRFPNGLATSGSDLAVQPDGRIVVLGRVADTFTVGRYLSDGIVDTQFGTQGFTSENYGNGLDIPAAIALRPDGKIVSVGYKQDYNENFFGFQPGEIVVSQLNADGSVDSSFGAGGSVIFRIDGIGSYATSVAIQSDGKLLVAGYTEPTAPKLFVARFLADGSFDSSFGTDGIASYGTDVQFVFDMKLQADGKIVLGGNSATGPEFYSAVTRLTADGSLDPSFGTLGVSRFLIGTSDSLGGIAILPDGKIIVSSGSDQLPDASDSFAYYAASVARLLPNGTLDNSFGFGGKKILNLGVGQEFGKDVLVQTDGKIVIIGDKSYPSGPFGSNDGGDFVVARLSNFSISVTNPNTVVNEGGVASNTGTWSEAVSISASLGSVVRNADQTWSWQFATTDGPDQNQTVTITATNIDGSSTTVAFGLLVANVAPTILISGSSSVDAGSNYLLNLSAIDPGNDTIVSWSVDWGDGVVQPIVGNPTTLAHVYATGGASRTIVAVATDEDGSYNSNSLVVFVNENDGPSVSVVAQVLKIVGTNYNDVIRVVPQGTSFVKVLINGSSYGPFALSSFNEINIFGKNGDDDLEVTGSIVKRAIILGGNGEDRIKGGAGPNVLVGGFGNDRINGGSQNDILIGGQGEDRLVGEDGEDILIGGYTLFDNHLEALRLLLAEWTRDSTYASRQSRMRIGGGLNGSYVLNQSTVKDDAEIDRLTGSAGRDWFFAQMSGNYQDIANDRKQDESIN